MITIDRFMGIWGLSCGFWMIYGLYVSFRIEKFIIKRYEQETELLNTIFFTEHATFSKWIPDFFSSTLYAGHLMMCLWGWRVYGNRKIFRDVEDPSIVTLHFSKREIRQVKWFLISCIMFVIHGVIYYMLKLFWPELL